MAPSIYHATLRNLLITVGVLACLGLIFVYSASSIFALEQKGIAHYFVQRQLYALIVGIFLALIISHIKSTDIEKFAPWCFVGMLGLLLIPTCMPAYARTIHGSARWITILGISFQPVEFAKISCVLALASIMSKTEFALRSLWQSLIPIICIILPYTILLLLQPDFGQTALCILTCLAMLTVAHPELKKLGILMAGTTSLMAILILAAPYRLRRILTFLNPWQDPQGKGFQVIQSLIAIGSGGLTGIGIGQSRQKFFYLPMQHTDFIFSIIAEETGLFGSLSIIGLYLLILYSGIRLALLSTNQFARLTIFGLTTMISCQALINVAVATGLAPTKGIGLPFVSYGLSSLLAHCCMIGIIIACCHTID